jgi:hypothetical protein
LFSLSSDLPLSESSAATNDGTENNPAVKLLDIYRAFLDAGESESGFVALSTDRTGARSRRMMNLKAITPKLMNPRCRQCSYTCTNVGQRFSPLRSCKDATGHTRYVLTAKGNALALFFFRS